MAVVRRLVRAAVDEEARRVALGERRLGDGGGRQLVVEVRQPHADRVRSAAMATASATPSRTDAVAVGDESFDLDVWLPDTGRGPGILLFQAIFGVGPYIHAVAQRLADLAYVVAAPDVFWRLPATGTPATTRPACRSRSSSCRSSTSGKE